MVGLRDRLIRNRTQLSNAIRGYAAEFGFTAARGMAHIDPLLDRIQADENVPVLIAPQLVKPYVKRGKNDTADAEALCEAMSRPTMRFVPVKTAEQQARELFAAQAEEYAQLQAQIAEVDAKLMAWHKADECSRRLAKIPGVGPIGAALLMMKTPAPEMFRSGRQFAAWIGLTPKDHSTAGKVRLGVITRAGDEALRSVLVVGATAVVQQVRRSGRGSPWIVDLLKRKPPKLAAVALANKMARIAWKLMVTGNSYAAKSAPAALMGAA
jgi:transposase